MQSGARLLKFFGGKRCWRRKTACLYKEKKTGPSFLAPSVISIVTEQFRPHRSAMLLKRSACTTLRDSAHNLSGSAFDLFVNTFGGGVLV